MSIGNLKLESTKNSEIVKEILEQNHAAWGGKLSVKEYLNREGLLQASDFAKNNLTTWILINENNDILSSCEVFKRPAYFGQAGFCFAIASVFTPEKHRRIGYAKTMLTRLAVILESEENSLGSSLYSDIGPKYYHDLGWKLHPSVSFIHTLSPSYNPTSTAVLLKNTDLPPFLSKFNKDCITTSQPNEFYTLPSPESHAWLFARSVYYSNAFGLDNVENVGARLGNDFATWFHDFKEGRLMITLTCIVSSSNAKELLDAAVVEAKKWKGLERVELWDPSMNLRGQSPEWKVVERTDSLSSLMTFGKGNGSVVWKNNEKFAWV